MAAKDETSTVSPSASSTLNSEEVNSLESNILFREIAPLAAFSLRCGVPLFDKVSSAVPTAAELQSVEGGGAPSVLDFASITELQLLMITMTTTTTQTHSEEAISKVEMTPHTTCSIERTNRSFLLFIGSWAFSFASLLPRSC